MKPFSHSIRSNPADGRKEAIPRHNEIKKFLAHPICRNLSVPIPQRNWPTTINMFNGIRIWLICVSLGLHLGLISTVKAASFTIDRNLVEYRAYFRQATLLTNGQVLMSGGKDDFGYSSFSSELYNPTTLLWAGTGGLNVARHAHTSTLLSDGRVLVVGGLDIYAFLTDSEIYDPISGSWSKSGNLGYPGKTFSGRYLHTATLLPNGKVLVAGGYIQGGFVGNDLEVFDPATGVWTYTGNLRSGRDNHTATLLPNGKVLIAGGNSFSGGYLANTELFDPATGASIATNSMNTTRTLHTATLLANGKVLVTGGGNSSAYHSSCEIYDPSTGTWTNTGSMNNARVYHTASLLTNGYVLVTGGQDSSTHVLSSAELYDPTAGVWRITASMNSPRSKCSATALTNGKILITPGSAASSIGNYATAELYDFWSATPPAIISQPYSRTNIEGDTVSFSVLAVFPPEANYQWRKDGTNLTEGGHYLGTASNLFQVQTLSSNDAGNYSVIVSNSYGSVSSSNAVLNLINPLYITLQPSNQIVPVGGTATFGVAAVGLGTIRYQWRFNGTNLYRNDIITTAAGNGTKAFSGDGGQATSASLKSPLGIAFDTSGNLFIADSENCRVRKVTTNGAISTVAGNGSSQYSGDGGQATNASLNFPQAIAVDNLGNLFITESSDRIRKITSNGIINTVVGNGISGYTGDGGQATNASLSKPKGIAFDASGNMLIADSLNHGIRRVTTNGIISTVAGNGIGGYSGDGGQATNASLYFPHGIAFDASGNMLIADTSNYRIRKVTSNGIISTVAGNGTGSYSGDGGRATNSSLNPEALAVGSSGDLFVADKGNIRVRKISSDGFITTVAGNGVFGYSGDEGIATNASLSFCYGIALNKVGDLFFSDYSNARIRIISASSALSKPTLTIDNVSVTNLGGYSVVITNAYRSITSITATLVLLQPPHGFNGYLANAQTFNLAFIGTPNYPYILQSATNLAPPAQWQPVITNTTDNSGQWRFAETNLDEAQKFYRVTVP
ncbi:MAG: kelch repeat-containing protein [Verrucomicrobiota bacterium]